MEFFTTNCHEFVRSCDSLLVFRVNKILHIRFQSILIYLQELFTFFQAAGRNVDEGAGRP